MKPTLTITLATALMFTILASIAWIAEHKEDVQPERVVAVVRSILR